MEIGEELKCWLQDTNKTYIARLDFAIKVWQSVDFVYINKYEVICEWLAEMLSQDADVHVAQLLQLFSLRAQPGLVSVASKTKLIKALLQRIDTNVSAPQLLQAMLNFELLQDALRADYELLMSSYGQLLSSYKSQILGNPADFVLPLLQQLRDYVQRAQNHQRLLQAYTTHALQPLCELLLQLRAHNVDCFEQLAALEQQLSEQLDMKEAIKRISEQPLHVQLLIMEAALVNKHFVPEAQHKLLSYVFENLLAAPKQLEAQSQEESQLALAMATHALAMATHALETLRKHSISLQFPAKKMSALSYLAKELCQFVKIFKESHLSEVLLLLCAALRLNPLLLEPNVYQITVWMLSAPKHTNDELCLYSAYLVQLLDMFRRLSRAERFVMQLLKALREWLAKFKLELPAARKIVEEVVSQPSNIYVQLIFSYNKSCYSYAPLPGDRLAQSWPSHSAGIAFTRLISHLMSKPSIVIWKMLLHSFAELLEPKSLAVLPANRNFAIELQAALLGQYLLGTRLAEQAQQYQLELEQQRSHTVQVLQQFGSHLLALEHNRRTMNAFLELVERALSFELLLAYYWPDGLPPAQLPPQQLHQFLPSAEWELLQQRVHNFGKSSCRQRLQRLELQLVESGWLLLSNQRREACTDALVEHVPRQLLGHLTRAQKQLRVQFSDVSNLLEDADCVELLTLQLLQAYADSLKQSKVKHALLVKQLPETPLDETALAEALRLSSGSLKQPALPLEPTVQLIDALQQLPLAQLVSSIKSRLWLLLFTLYHDVSRAQLTEQANQLLEQLIDLLHFGQPPPLCSYFPDVEQLLQLVPIVLSEHGSSTAWRFYETFFGRCIRRLGVGSDAFLTKCVDYFKQLLNENQTLQLDQWKLLLLAIETVSLQSRRNQRQLQPLLEIYGQFVNHKFRSQKKLPAVYKDFVQTTLSGYAVYLSSCVNSNNNASNAKQKEDKDGEPPQKKARETVAIDENFRRICKIYIGHSLNYRNAHAIRLLNVALTHRQLLHLDLDEIEFVLNSYWQQLNADIESESALDIRTIEPAIKLIIGYKTNEDFLLLLRQLTNQMDAMQRPESAAQHACLQNVLTLITLFAKCSLSSVKGAILNEHFELISGNVGLRLPAVSDAAYRSHVMRLLEAQRALAGNRTVPLTGETLDSMLGSMLDVNIKRFVVAGGAWQDFLQLHAAISENCLLLLRQHGTLMSDRASQLTALCQDLIQAIVCYRSERKQAQTLSEDELDGLAELGLKLVTLIAGIASGSQALAVKRVAPFLLIFTIKQMVATERPTTLYEKVKVHLNRICHELISLCDHRAGHFILRASSEAGAGMYQSLVKEHDKYHKFRGKV